MNKIKIYVIIFIALALALFGFVYFSTRANHVVVADEIVLEERRGEVMALIDKNLAVLSPERFVFHDASGREQVSRAVAFELPALEAAGEKIIAFDRLGDYAIIADQNGIRTIIETPVLTAAGNNRGEYILITSAGGYQSVAQFYDSRDRLSFAWFSAERHLLAAAISPSGRRIAVAGVSQQGDTPSTGIIFFETGEEEPLGVAEIPGELPLALYSPTHEHFYLKTESGLHFFSSDGERLGEYSFGNRNLISSHPTETAIFLNLGQAGNSRHNTLIAIDYTGEALNEMEFPKGITAIAGAGRWLAIIERDNLTRFSIRGGELEYENLGTAMANNLKVNQSGDVLLIYPGVARWFK